MPKEPHIETSLFVGTSPVRAFIICEDLPFPSNVDQRESTMEVFLNPMSLDLESSAVWSNIDVPGLSHQVHQYSHSKSNTIDFELGWDKILAEQRRAAINRRKAFGQTPITNDQKLRESQTQVSSEPHKYKDFLYGLTVPMAPGQPPSRVTLIWPKFLHTTGFVNDVKFGFTRFAANGSVMSFRARISMTELRTTFRQRADVNQFFWSPQQGTTQFESDDFGNYEITTTQDIVESWTNTPTGDGWDT